MLKYPFNVDFWSSLTAGAAAIADRSPFDTHAHVQRNLAKLEREDMISRWDGASFSLLNSRIVLATTRAASGL